MPKIIWSDYTDGTPCRIKYFGEKQKKPWMDIKFQAKPIREVGQNGMCMLDIIDALVKRLDDFQAKWPCGENENAIRGLREAQEFLKAKRIRRNSEKRNKA